MTLEQLRKLCDEATPGPWPLDHITDLKDVLGNPVVVRNARFIAAARTYLPLLLAVAEAARGEYCCCCPTNDERFETIRRALDELDKA